MFDRFFLHFKDILDLFVSPFYATKSHKKHISFYMSAGGGWHTPKCVTPGVTTTSAQRPKKSKLSGWQSLMRKNFPDNVRKLFSGQMHQKNA